MNRWRHHWQCFWMFKVTVINVSVVMVIVMLNVVVVISMNVPIHFLVQNVSFLYNEINHYDFFSNYFEPENEGIKWTSTVRFRKHVFITVDVFIAYVISNLKMYCKNILIFRFKEYIFIEQHTVDVYMEFNRNKIQFKKMPIYLRYVPTPSSF